MTKEQKIKEVYKDLYESHGHLIDENGWLDNSSDTHYLTIGQTKFLGDCDYKNDKYFRPKTLKGIENNNGWIKIESEADLPKNILIMYRIGMFLNDGKFYQDNNLCNHQTAFNALTGNYTHYQPINKPESPLY